MKMEATSVTGMKTTETALIIIPSYPGLLHQMDLSSEKEGQRWMTKLFSAKPEHGCAAKAQRHVDNHVGTRSQFMHEE